MGLARILGRIGAGVRGLLEPRYRFARCGLYEDRQAYRRSRELLLECLSPSQRGEFERRGAFTVCGQSGRRYRIAYGTGMNIEVLGPGGEVEYRLCAAPADVPTPAVMLAQKLMLEAQEAEFLRIAIKHPAASPLHGGGWHRTPFPAP